MRRVTQADVDRALEDVVSHGVALEIEGAERWAVGNPYGPDGLHLMEVDPEHGGVDDRTKLGTYYWRTKGEAYQGLRTLANALHAARKATVSGDRFSEEHQVGNL